MQEKRAWLDASQLQQPSQVLKADQETQTPLSRIVENFSYFGQVLLMLNFATFELHAVYCIFVPSFLACVSIAA